MDENTPLHFAVLFEDEECAMLLLNNGADVNTKNLRDELPIDLAEPDSDVVSFVKQYTREKAMEK